MSCSAVQRAAAAAAGLTAFDPVARRSTAIPDASVDTALLADVRRVENRPDIPQSLAETAALYGITVPADQCFSRRARLQTIRELQTLQQRAVWQAQYRTWRVPSRFVANTARQNAALQISEGWVNQWPDPQQRGRFAVRTRGLNGDGVQLGGQRDFGNLVVFSRDTRTTPLNPRNPGRTPSKFTANTAADAANLVVTQGWVDENDFANPQTKFRNGIRTLGLGGTSASGQRTFGNACTVIRSFGSGAGSANGL